MSTLGPLDSLVTHRFVSQVYESVVLAFDIEVSLVQVIEHEFCSNALEVGVDIEGWHRGALMFVKLGRHGGDIVLAISPPRSRTFNDALFRWRNRNFSVARGTMAVLGMCGHCSLLRGAVL